MQREQHEDAIKTGIVTVGAGRGFIMDAGAPHGRVILTAAHCLPHFPPCMTMSHIEERTYQALVGGLDEEPSIWVECLFVDPIADIAVLGGPDSQSLFDESDAYEAFVESRPYFRYASLPLLPPWDDESARAGQVLSLAGEWQPCTIQCGPKLSLRHVITQGGMSGSPIVADGCAVGVICTGHVDHSPDDPIGEGPQPRLDRDLPSWLTLALASDTGH